MTAVPTRSFLFGLILLASACRQAAPQAAPVLSAGEALTIPYSSPAGLVLVQGTMGESEELGLLLDTGVNPSVLDLAKAQELGIPLDGRNPFAVAGAGNRALLAYPADVSDLRLGGTRLTLGEAVAMDMTDMAQALGTALHGALGYSLLSGRIMTVDPGARQVILREPPWESEAPSVPLQLVGGTPWADEVFIDGRKIRAALDTGAQPMITISTARAAALGLGDLLASADSGTVRGARGSARVLRARADSLRIGQMSLQDVPVTFADWVEDGDAIVGMEFFGHFVTTFDYASRRLFLETSETGTDTKP